MKFRKLFETEIRTWHRAKDVEDMTHEVVTSHGFKLRGTPEHVYDSPESFDGHQKLHDDLLSIGWKPKLQDRFSEKWDRSYKHPDHPLETEMVYFPDHTSVGFMGNRPSPGKYWARRYAG